MAKVGTPGEKFTRSSASNPLSVIPQSPNQSSGANSQKMALGPNTAVLPEIKKDEGTVEKQQPHPSSIPSDFIPKDILLALTCPPPQYDKLGPPTRYRNLNTTTGQPKRGNANVWNFPKRREMFKHLTENTPCICGAGKDISFLYDVPKKELVVEKPGLYDSSAARVQEEEEDEDEPPKRSLKLPDTLIPDEYHIVKNRGVMGLEYYEDKFATHPDDHESHLVQFPSMYPTSRYEVLQLKKTLGDMLQKAGVNEDDDELEGPTQMHNLLELIKKEQNIYNVIFHELIRQVSVECLDRGELLAQLRGKYSDLLNKIPKQIKGLHQEVLAQRALDRRLTEELMRFKTTISILTSELTAVKEHDQDVTKKANQAQDDLKSALAESQKNAGLLAEYHDLYELQRKRLEKQVTMLGEEKEIWSTVAYSLALKVMEEHSLNTAKRLHVSEKSWSKLANHFTILLSDNDTVVLTKLQSHVDKWRDLVEDFNMNMKQREQGMRDELLMVRNGMQAWIREFQKHHLSKMGHLKQPPDQAKVSRLYEDIRAWEQLMSQESEKFGGDVVLTGQEYLTSIRQEMYGWTDCALKIFSRHQLEEGKEHPDQTDMQKLNDEIELMLLQFNVRLTGENGAATGIIHISNNLESWDSRINTVLHGSNPMPDQEWLRFYQLLDDWSMSLDETIALIGDTQREDCRSQNLTHRHIDIMEVCKMSQKWLSSTTNGIDSEDAKLVETVSSLHTEMVKWMVQMLLRLAPDREDHSKEARAAVLLGSATLTQLKSNARSLISRLAAFSSYVTQCCKAIVTAEMQEKIDQREEDPDLEFKALQKMGVECNEWISVGKMLLTELTGEVIKDTPVTSMTDILADVKTPETKSAEPSQQEPQADNPPDGTTHSLEGTTEAVEDSEDQQGEKPDEMKDEPEEKVQTPAEQTEAEQTAEEQAPDDNAPSEQQAEGSGETQEPTEEVLETSPPEPTDDDQKLTEQDPEQEHTTKEVSFAAEDSIAVEEPVAKEQLEVIGYDANTHKRDLDDRPESPPPAVLEHRPERPLTPDTKKAYEALAAMDSLQAQLMTTEVRAQEAEERASNAEAHLKAAREKLRALERQLGETETSDKPKSATSAKADPKPEPKQEPAIKTEKPPEREKTKEKSNVSRSSSRTSTKSKKK